MPRVGFESKISVFERPKKFRALDRASAVIGILPAFLTNKENKLRDVFC
jgi:hypothetical protein